MKVNIAKPGKDPVIVDIPISEQDWLDWIKQQNANKGKIKGK